MRKIKGTLKAYVSSNSLSYIINDKGNGRAVTIEGWGSCTPQHVLQDMIDRMATKVWNDTYKRCDKAAQKII